MEMIAVGTCVILVAAAWWIHRWRIKREKRRIAAYFSSITGNKSEDFLRIINGETFESVFGAEREDNRANAKETEARGG
jgi:hypothetical protein